MNKQDIKTLRVVANMATSVGDKKVRDIILPLLDDLEFYIDKCNKLEKELNEEKNNIKTNTIIRYVRK